MSSALVRSTILKSTVHFKFEWTIVEFNRLNHKSGERIWSPIFQTKNSTSQWQLCLYPRGESLEVSDYVSIFLHLHSCKDEPISIDVNCEISIPEISHSSNFMCTFDELDGRGYDKFAARSRILGICDANGTFTVHCDMVTLQDDLPECPGVGLEQLEPPARPQGSRLSEDFTQLLKASKMNDVTLIAGAERFPAHKVILAARSPVFMAMFDNKETKESLTNEVEIEGMTPGAVAAMLEFFYTDAVTNLEALAWDLVEAAEKYDIQSLKEMCEEELDRALTTENAAELLMHADLHRCGGLKERSMRFMVDHLCEVIGTESYQRLKNEHSVLGMELLDFIAAQSRSIE